MLQESDRRLSGCPPRLEGETLHVGGLGSDEPLCGGPDTGEVLSAPAYPRSLRRQLL